MTETSFQFESDSSLGLLIKISAQTCDIFEKALNDGIDDTVTALDVNHVYSIFIRKLQQASAPVFLAIEKTGFIYDILKDMLKDEHSHIVDYDTDYTLITNIFTNNENISNIAMFHGIYGLWDKSLTEKLYLMHTEYDADFSFAENLPEGIAPRFISQSYFEALQINKTENFDLNSFNLINYTEKNIDKFHVEIHYEEPDLRILRLNFSSNSFRSLTKTARLLKHIEEAQTVYDKIYPAIKLHPEVLFSQPSYIQIELAAKTEHTPRYSAASVATKSVADMSSETFNNILSITNQSFDDLSFAFSGLSDPLLHEQFIPFTEKIIENKKIKNLVIETSGHKLDIILPLLDNEHFHKIKMMILVNSLSNYHELHQTKFDTLKKIEENIKMFTDKFRQKYPGIEIPVFIETQKITDNEKEYDEIYEWCQKLGVQFLLKKFNRYIDLLEEKRVSDMTPLERSPCWHLRRELFIRADGTVTFCQQDIQNKNIRGNVNEQNINTIWQSAANDWVKNLQEIYPQSPECAKCDEYYTFNL